MDSSFIEYFNFLQHDCNLIIFVEVYLFYYYVIIYIIIVIIVYKYVYHSSFIVK